MESDLLTSEFERIKKRDNRQIKVLATGYILITLFGFLSLTLLLNSLQVRYEDKFRQFEIETTELVKQIEIKDSTYKEIDDALKDADLNFKEEINKLWRSAYVKARDNEKKLTQLEASTEAYNNSIGNLGDNFRILEEQVVRVSNRVDILSSYVERSDSPWHLNSSELRSLSVNFQAIQEKVGLLEQNLNSKTQELEGEINKLNQSVDSLKSDPVNLVESNKSIQPTVNESVDEVLP